MASPTQMECDGLMRAMAQRFGSSRQSRYSSRTSPAQHTRRHSARIEKPRSHQPSPMTPERRRVVNAPKHYSAMEDHYRRMMGLDEDEDQEEAVNQQYQPSLRPVSWHPGYQSSYNPPDVIISSMYSADPSPTSQYLSYQNSPFHQNAAQQPKSESAWSHYMRCNFNAAAAQSQAEPGQQDLTPWFDDSQTQQHNNRITSNWTEQQEHEEHGQKYEREQSVELVGLGLYDEPGFTIKIGSKLEEECDPPEFDADDDDNDDSSEEEEEELPKPEDARVTQASLPMVDMSGQSFLVGSDEGFEKSSWWSNSDSKHPQAQVDEVSYGWI